MLLRNINKQLCNGSRGVVVALREMTKEDIDRINKSDGMISVLIIAEIILIIWIIMLCHNFSISQQKVNVVVCWYKEVEVIT